MAKRSPILGYNHNVRYRGLVFHVQTEDSGVLSPHMFTHLFHTGVIVSTRKLVYDSGSAEEAIKSLMQAQHKAVLKDLRRGHFDDKIDEYLGKTPGLLPRGSVDPGAGAEEKPELARASSPAMNAATEPTPKLDPVQLLDDGTATRRMSADELDLDLAQAGPGPQAPILATLPELAEKDRRDPTIPDVRPGLAARAVTAERRSAPSRIGTPPPMAEHEMGAVTAAISAANNATIRTPMPEHDSAPEIEIQLELDDEPLEMESPRDARRPHRDTDLAVPDEHSRPTVDVNNISDGIPSMTGGGATIRQVNDSIPPLPAPPSTEVRRTPSAGVGASSLPPGKPITRPPQRPAMTPQQVVTRPVTANSDSGANDRGSPSGDRRRGESDSIEVYAPAPPSADTPPGLREAERPGQYSQHKRGQREPTQPRDRSQNIPVPPGLGRPGRIPQPAPPVPRPPPTPPARESQPIPVPIIPVAQPPETVASRTNPRPRTPTPARTSPNSPANPRAGTPSSGGVVMTRPAVIVGAPSKPSPPRVRKAREDEGRGFGQGLISEKSLDEVILAYLSEDADDK